MGWKETLWKWFSCGEGCGEKSSAEFLSEEQIVQDIISKMTDDNIRSYMLVRRQHLIRGHMTTGRAIRNEYRLWNERNPHVVLSDPNHRNFPDQMTMRIMQRVWQKAFVLAYQRGIPQPTEKELREAETLNTPYAGLSDLGKAVRLARGS